MFGSDPPLKGGPMEPQGPACKAAGMAAPLPWPVILVRKATAAGMDRWLAVPLARWLTGSLAGCAIS